MAKWKVHVWQEQYGTVEIDAPSDASIKQLEEAALAYVNEHKDKPDSGVNVDETSGWWIDTQPEPEVISD